MSYTMHVFVMRKRGSPMEDLGAISVTPKPVRSEFVHFHYWSRSARGLVALIDPYNWEKRPGVVPTIYVQLRDGG